MQKPVSTTLLSNTRCWTSPSRSFTYRKTDGSRLIRQFELDLLELLKAFGCDFDQREIEEILIWR